MSSTPKTRRCSCCRQTGHNIRNCPHSAAVHYQGEIFNIYISPRDNLIQFVYSYFIQRISELHETHVLCQSLYDQIYFYVIGMTYRELKTALKNPVPTINYCYEYLLLLIENLTAQHHNTHLGSHYAKKIDIHLTDSTNHHEECVICCDKISSVKTSCGHEYCDNCITGILNENKNKSSPPLCSFCKAPFRKFIISDTFAFSYLSEFIQNLS